MTTERTQAGTRKTRWPGWIWAIPIAAVALVAWLLIRAISGGGIKVTVVFDNAGGAESNATEVRYRGVKVGQASDVSITPDRQHVTITLSIDGTMKSALTTGTRFYLQGAHPSLGDLSSLKAVVSGPTIVLVPGTGTPARHFVGIPTAPPDSVETTAHYLVRLEGDAGDLQPGAPVMLRGFEVGHVLARRLTYDAATDSLTTPVMVGLDTTRLAASAVTTLVHTGLHARLVHMPPVIGAAAVELAMLPGAPTRVASDEIPAAPGEVRLSDLPIAAISSNVRAITSRVRTLVSAPQLQAAIDHLDATLATLDTTVRAVAPQVQPMIQQLSATATDLDATVASVKRVTGESPASPDGNLRDALRELTGAARAMRTLANFLDQHPEALVSGRQR